LLEGHRHETEARNKEALADYKKAIDLQPSLRLAHNRYGALLARCIAARQISADYSIEALQHLDRSADGQDRSKALYYTALMMNRRGDFASAIEICRDLVNNMRDSSGIFRWLY
jgi:tetratricopeptide (TPR) repeat protein